jgi:SSS family solute:Na+ symporter
VTKDIRDTKKSYLLISFVAFFIYLFFIFLGVLFYNCCQSRTVENENVIILHFAAGYGVSGLTGIIIAAVMAAFISSLNSIFNLLLAISTSDFDKKYFRKMKQVHIVERQPVYLRCSG